MSNDIGVNSAKDSDFMKWLVDRLIYVYKEDEQTDFVQRTRMIADKLDKIENFTKDHSTCGI